MRIALISNRLPPHPDALGAQIYAGDLADALAERHEVLILTGAGTPRHDRIQVARLPTLPSLDGRAGVGRKVRWQVRDQWNAGAYTEIRRQLRRFAPDVVHTHKLHGLSAAALRAAAAAPCSQVHTAHDLSLLCLRVAMTRGGEPCGGQCTSCLVHRRLRRAGFAADRLIAPSEYCRRLH